jgi:hypothetical protein
MKEIRIIAVILGLLASVMAVAQDGALAKEGNKLQPLPRDLEMQLALSALPPLLQARAQVAVAPRQHQSAFFLYSLSLMSSCARHLYRL